MDGVNIDVEIFEKINWCKLCTSTSNLIIQLNQH
jgi:hypothetical protein